MPDRLDRVQVQLASRVRPVVLSRHARDRLIRRIGHLEAAKSIVAKLDAAGASRLVEFSDGDKGVLVVAIKAWMLDVGHDRVPGDVLRLRDGLLDDLRGTPSEPEIQTTVDRDEAAAGPEQPAEDASGLSPADVEARLRLLSVHDVIEHELRVLRELDDARLDAALDAMEKTRAEIVAAVAALGSPPNDP